MATAPAQQDPAEGAREDEPAADTGAGSAPQQIEPAEGADDAPAGGGNSPG